MPYPPLSVTPKGAAMVGEIISALIVIGVLVYFVILYFKPEGL